MQNILALDDSIIFAAIANSRRTLIAPTQELECCGFTAEIVTVPPNLFQIAQVKSSQGQQSMEFQELVKKKLLITLFTYRSPR